MMRSTTKQMNEKVFYEAVRQTYKSPRLTEIDGFRLLKQNENMTAYGNGKDIIIGVRGMRMLDPNDYLTDVELAQNNLADTPKYQSSKRFVNEVFLEYPESNVYLSGHSLGGAIATQLKRDFPQIKYVIEFNPAFQPKDIFASPSGILRIYQSRDWIYNLLQGKLIANRVVDSGVRTPFQAHSIESFRAMYSPVKDIGDRLGFAE